MNYAKLLLIVSTINCSPSKIDTNLKDLKNIIDKVKQDQPVYIDHKLLSLKERRELRNRMWASVRCLECKEVNGKTAIEEIDPNL
jgi:hypothetical protein